MECTKTKFATEAQCDFYIKKLKDTSSRKVKPTRAYLCPHCTSWHLTSQTAKDVEKLEKLYKKIKSQKQSIVELHEVIKKLKNKKI